MASFNSCIRFIFNIHFDSSWIFHEETKFSCHSSLNPDLHSFEQIRRIARPTDVPDTGLLCDLLWSDPDKDALEWGENDRGVSFTFGAEVVTRFLTRHDLDLICRGHQVLFKWEEEWFFFLWQYMIVGCWRWLWIFC